MRVANRRFWIVKRLAGALVLLCLSTPAAPVAAQSWLSSGPEVVPLPAVRQPVADPADLATRVDRLEEVVRRLNSEVEALRRRLGEAGVAEAPNMPPLPDPAPSVNAATKEPRPVQPPRAAAAGAVAEGPPTSLLPLPPRTLPGPPAATGAIESAQLPVLPTQPSQEPAPLRGDQPAASGQLAALPAPANDGAGSAYAAAYAHLLSEEMVQAGEAFAEFVKRYPAHELAGNAQYWLAESHFARANYARAAREFLTGYTKYRSSPKAPDSLLKLGLTLLALGRDAEACASFGEMAKRFPKADRAVHERAAEEAANAGC